MGWKLNHSDKMLHKITSTSEMNDFIWGEIDIERWMWSYSIAFLAKKFPYQNKWVLYDYVGLCWSMFVGWRFSI